MGNIITQLRKPRKIVVLGLQNAGKSTIIQLLKHKYMSVKMLPINPTKGLLVSGLKVNKKNYVLWEMGGYEEIRPFYHCYCLGLSGMIFVIDGSDKNKNNNSIKLLSEVLQDSIIDKCVLLILIHKNIDEDDYTDLKEKVDELLKNRIYNIFHTDIEKEESIINAFDWMNSKIK